MTRARLTCFTSEGGGEREIWQLCCSLRSGEARFARLQRLEARGNFGGRL